MDFRFYLIFALVVGCASTEEPQDACTDLICSYGTCVVEAGKPRCACTLEEIALGAVCEIVATYADAVPDSREEALTVTVPLESMEGEINPSRTGEADEDWFRFEARGGFKYRVWCEGTGSAFCDVQVFSDREPYRPLAESTWTISVDTTYFVRITSRAGDPGKYRWGVEVSPAPDDTAEDALIIHPDEASENVFESSSDLEFYRFHGLARHVYRMEVEATEPITIDAIGNGVALVSASRSVVFGSNAPLLWFLVLSGQSAPLPYTWRLQDLGLDDHGNDPGDETPLTPGESVEGAFEYPGDRDHFRFEADAGSYLVRCIPVTGDCSVQVRNAPKGTPSGPSFTVTFTEATTAIPMVTGTGNYVLEVLDANG